MDVDPDAALEATPDEARGEAPHEAEVELLTVGHGTLAADELGRLLAGAGVAVLVDVRSYPGSRRHPQFGREALESWLPELGIEYRWDGRLGGRRPARPDSVNTALRNDAFRGYADHMAGERFRSGLHDLVELAARRRTAAMCAETLWWRCHRRLLADVAVLIEQVTVRHLLHDGRLAAHAITQGARVTPEGTLVYDVGGDQPLPFG
jgi:uncharacterized protein (DUF488 family)